MLGAAGASMADQARPSAHEPAMSAISAGGKDRAIDPLQAR
jgi:hypothetical protein